MHEDDDDDAYNAQYYYCQKQIAAFLWTIGLSLRDTNHRIYLMDYERVILVVARSMYRLQFYVPFAIDAASY